MELITVSPRRSSTSRTLHNGSGAMTRSIVILALCLLLVPCLLSAQQTKDETGRVAGDYTIQQSIEFGGRITGIEGNSSMYNTFVNLHDGPRLLEQTFSMRSMSHTGNLLDDLYIHSYGYGGDPEAGTLIRASKNRWFDFVGNYRRDQNYFDYNLMDNPFNTPGGYVQWNKSPHMMDTRRNMGDFNLTIAPQSAIRLRLGYSRNVNEGPSYTTFHEGTELSLYQNFRDRQDQYRIGVDVRIAPRTQLSFDQFYDYNKNDTSWSDRNLTYLINAGAAGYKPVDIGAVYNTYYGQPCSNTPPMITPTAGVGNVVKAGGCNLYFEYNRFGPQHGTFPTSQLSFTSSYFKKLDITATGSYSSGENKMDTYNERANTFITRTYERAFQFTGPAKVKRISANADIGLTYRINDNWAISNQFHYLNWRIPGAWNSTEIACFPNVASGATILTPIGAPNGASTCAGYPTSGTPYHTSSSGPDVDLYSWVQFHSDKAINDTILLQWDPNRKFGMHVGGRFGTRTAGYKDLSTDTATYYGANVASAAARTLGTFTTATDIVATEEQTEQTILVGFNAHPVDAWRVNADFETMYVDTPFTNIAPGHQQKFKLRSAYRMNEWFSVSGSIFALENRNSIYNDVFPTTIESSRHQDHSRNYSLDFEINPKEWVDFNFGWSYQDIYSNSAACLPMSGGATGLVPQGGQIARCTGAVAGEVPLVLLYQQNTNSAYTYLTLKPAKRVTMKLGYDLTSDAGQNNWLRADTLAPFNVPVDANGNVVYTATNPIVGYAAGPNPFQPLGPLGINWHKPFGTLELALNKNVTFKGGYNYYGYNEKSNPGVIAVPRDFHANTGTLSLKYSF